MDTADRCVGVRKCFFCERLTAGTKEDCYEMCKKDESLEHKNLLECYPEWRMCYDRGPIIDDTYRTDDRNEMC